MPSNPVSFGVGTNTDFTILSQPTDLILSAGESTIFTIQYTPTVAGAASGEIIIANDDPDLAEQTFSFNIAGDGVVPIPSPGNISSDLQLWMKANVGTSLTGSDVDSWVDQSPNGFTATSAGVSDAQLVNNGMNFNPVLRFAGSEFLNLGSPAALNLQPLTDEMTIITVVQSNSSGTIISKADNDNANYQVWFDGTDRVLHHTLGKNIADAPNTSTRLGTIYALEEPKITAGIVADTGLSSTRLSPYMNGFLDTAVTNEGISNGSVAADVLIGARRVSVNTGSDDLFTGDVAEVVVYDRDLTATEQARVQSYLALKYGVTLGANEFNWTTGPGTSVFAYGGTSDDYVDSNGTVIWDGSANAGYGYNIFGIVRDDNSQFEQTQSSSVNRGPEDVLTITKESGSFASNLTYLIIGNNGLGETIQTTTLPLRTAGMLNKIWHAHESATDIDTVELVFDMSGSGLTNLDDLELYIADSDTFAAYENYEGTNVGGVLTFTGINLEDGQYFTLGEPQTVTGNSALFFDGVDDFVEDNSPVTRSLTGLYCNGMDSNPGQPLTLSIQEILGVSGQYRFYLSGGLLAIQEGFTGGAPRAGN